MSQGTIKKSTPVVGLLKSLAARFVVGFYGLWDVLPRLLLPVKPPNPLVLVIKTDALGDFLLMQPFLERLRELPMLEGRELAIVAAAPHEQLLQHAGVQFEHFVAADSRQLQSNPFYRLKLLWRIRRLRPEIVINGMFSRLLLVDEAMVRVATAPEVIAMQGEYIALLPRRLRCLPLQRMLWPRLQARYTQIVPVDEQQHEFVRNQQFFAALGMQASVLPCVPGLEHYPESPVSGRYCVLGIGSALDGKCWPTARFAQVATHVYEQHGLIPVLVGSERERWRADEIVARCQNIPCRNLVGATAIPSFISLISHAALVVTNDSAALHIAALSAVPLVCILGGGHFGRFAPYDNQAMNSDMAFVFEKMSCYDCDWHCIHKVAKQAAYPCIDRVTEIRVIAEIDVVLSHSTDRRSI